MYCTVLQVLRKADELEDHFNHFDTNANGTIDDKELGKLLKACGQHVPKKKDLKKMYALLDKDDSGTINFDEFCEMMLGKQLDIGAESMRINYRVLGMDDCDAESVTAAQETDAQCADQYNQRANCE